MENPEIGYALMEFLIDPTKAGHSAGDWKHDIESGRDVYTYCGGDMSIIRKVPTFEIDRQVLTVIQQPQLSARKDVLTHPKSIQEVRDFLRKVYIPLGYKGKERRAIEEAQKSAEEQRKLKKRRGQQDEALQREREYTEAKQARASKINECAHLKDLDAMAKQIADSIRGNSKEDLHDRESERFRGDVKKRAEEYLSERICMHLSGQPHGLFVIHGKNKASST